MYTPYVYASFNIYNSITKKEINMYIYICIHIMGHT